MGVYLPKPNTEKISYHGGKESETLTSFGLSSMQGWRQSMEDAHLSITSLRVDPFSQPVSIYGVFDGHGGAAVSLWVAHRFESVFCHELQQVKKRAVASQVTKVKGLQVDIIDVCEALRQTYLTLDRLMDRSEGREELKRIYEKEEGKKEPLTNVQSTAPREQDTILDSWLMSVSTEKQLVKIFEKDGRKFYKVVESSTVLSTPAPQVEEVFSDGNEKEPKLGSPPSDVWSPKDNADHQEEGPSSPFPKKKDDEGSVSWKDSSLPSSLESQDNHQPSDASCASPPSDQHTTPHDPPPLSPSVEKDPTQATPITSPDNSLGSVAEYYDTAEEDYLPVDESRSQPYHPEGCGCTAVVVVIVGDKEPQLITANAGDSRAVLCRQNRAIALSQDHKPGLPRETKRIYDAGGTVSFGRVEGNLNLSRALGDLCYKSDPSLPPEKQKISGCPDISVVTLHPSDQFVILACDGIWDCLSNQEAVDFVLTRLEKESDPPRLSQICQEMCDYCLCQNPFDSVNGVGCDNMTVILVALHKMLIGHATSGSPPRLKCLIRYTPSSDTDDHDEEETSVEDYTMDEL